MLKHYESYVYIDLTALRDRHVEGDERASPPAAASCAGKVLLVMTGRGMEVVHVPDVLN